MRANLMGTKSFLAFDFGAESGRAVMGRLDGERVSIEELHRFPTAPVDLGGHLHWNLVQFLQEIKAALRRCADDLPVSLGIDTWGVDFGLLDRDRRLMGNPVHYRDARSEGMAEWVYARVPARELYERTGIQYLSVNTIYQLAGMVARHSAELERADLLLPMPSLLNFWLTGVAVAEFSHVTTSGLYNPHLADWDREVLERLGVPTHIFPEIVAPGTRVGEYQGIPVIAPATHDTGSAVVAVPATTRDDFAYLSSGTWSLLGVEVDAPIITEAAFRANLTNEGGVYGTFRFLKNVAGLWLAQECRRAWMVEGRSYRYDELVELAREAEPFRSLVDPDDPVFTPRDDDMPARIRAFCARTGQPVPETVGQMMRAIYESLALKYRIAMDHLEELTGRKLTRLHIVGGGSQNRLLNQMAADATGREVVAGPVEATALGNAIVQLITLGEIDNVAQARALLSQAESQTCYDPHNTPEWEEALARFKALLAPLGQTRPD